MTEAHVEHDCLRGPREMVPIDGLVRIVLGVAGDEDQRLRMVAMSQRNAGVRRATCRCCHSWHDFEPHARSCEGFELLATATEDERIAALEPAHPLALLRELHEQRVDLVLGNLRTAARLADVDALSVATREIEDLRGHEPVIQDHVCILQRSQSTQRQQTRIAWTGADEHDLARVLAAGCESLLDLRSIDT